MTIRTFKTLSTGLLAIGLSTAPDSLASPPATRGDGFVQTTPDDPPAKAGGPRKADDKAKDPKSAGETKAAKAPALSFKMKDIDGNEQDLAQYYGKVVLIVNTASKCGYTPQYGPLQELYQVHQERGLVVLAFPANNFNEQEPGTNAEIKEFCTNNFSVTFPVFSKVSVKGKDACPLYKYLTATDAGHEFGGDIAWNFNKFLISRKGEIVGRYKQNVHPRKDKKFTEDVEKALKEPVPSDAPQGPEKPVGRTRFQATKGIKTGP